MSISEAISMTSSFLNHAITKNTNMDVSNKIASIKDRLSQCLVPDLKELQIQYQKK